MSDRISLRDFQAQLAERLKDAGQQSRAASKLGFTAGGRHFLTDLDQINEVVTQATLTPVPWAKSWFVGIVNVRGALYGATDLALYRGLGNTDSMPAPEGDETRNEIQGEARFLLAHPRFGVNAALRIDQALGLRLLSDMQRQPAPSLDWAMADWQDSSGQIWTEISIEQLVADPAFLQAGE